MPTYCPEVTGLHLSLLDTLHRIDDALDRGDRRAFRVWSTHYVSLSARLSGLLVKIAQE